MKNLPYYLIVLFALSVNGTIQAQSVPTDSIPSKEEKNRNVMLNAADASKPREVSIGLPSYGAGFLSAGGRTVRLYGCQNRQDSQQQYT